MGSSDWVLACSFSQIIKLRVEWKGRRKAVSQVSKLILTNNLRLIFLVFDKNKCHFQNYSFKVCDDILMCVEIIGNVTVFRWYLKFTKI